MKRLITISLLIVMSACTAVVEVERSAEFYKEDGDNFFEKKEYKKAIQAYENALVRAETPEFASEIQLNLANSYFNNKKYSEAIPIYETYLDVYAGTPNEVEATLKLGLAHYHLDANPHRDQTDIIAAKSYFQKIIAISPALAEENMLQSKINDINEMLAEKELIVAKYYSRIGKPEQAIGRLKYLVSTYPDSKVYPEAAYVLIKNLQDDTEKENYLILMKLKYPENKFTKKAENLVN